MGDLNAQKSFPYSKVSLSYTNKGLGIAVGRTADLITTFRPYPISFSSQFEYVGTAVIPGTKLTALATYKTGNFTIGFSASEAGERFGDSTRYAVRAWYQGFSAGIFVQDRKPGAAMAYNREGLELCSYYWDELWSGYVQARCSGKSDLHLAVDWAYRFAGQDWRFDREDFLEVMLLKFFSYGPLVNKDLSGLYGLGVSNDGYVNVYFGLTF